MKWIREPTDVWIVEGSSHSITCEADGLPLPVVILSRVNRDRRLEVSRGIKTTSFNISADMSRDRETSSFVCETSSEGAKLEKEFKIFRHGQFSAVIPPLSVGPSGISFDLRA
jgi:hypothetical protein